MIRTDRARSTGAAVALAIGVAQATMAKDSMPGEFHQERLGADGARYTLSVPAGYSAERPAPLVLSLHYGGPVSPWYGRALVESVVEPALRPLGAIVVAPDCPERAWAECEAAVIAILDHVATRFAIDPRRTLVTGYSKGGIGTWAFARRHPDRFAAAIVMAGRPPEDAAEFEWRIPIRAIAADADELFPVSVTREAIAALEARGADVSLEVLEGVTHYEVPRFAAPLARAVPWLVERWKRGSGG